MSTRRRGSADGWSRPRVAAVVLGGLAMVLILALASRTAPVAVVTGLPEPASATEPTDGYGETVTPRVFTDAPKRVESTRDSPEIPAVVGPALIALGIVVGALLLLVGIAAVARRLAGRGVPPPDAGDAEVVVDLTRVQAHLVSSRHELTVTDDVGTAIVACWEGLESAASRGGRGTRRPAETAGEFVARILDARDLSARQVRALAVLYEAALFSTTRLTEADRHAAMAALDALTAELAPAQSGSGQAGSGQAGSGHNESTQGHP